jgi:hypothetical protein
MTPLPYHPFMCQKGNRIGLTGLSLHRPNTRILEKEPVVHFVPLPRALGEADLVVRIVAIDQVLHDASRFEKVDAFAVGEGVG